MSLFDVTAPSIDKLVLERMRVGARQVVGASVVESMRLEQWVEPMSRGLVHALTAEVLAEKLPPERIDKSQTFGMDFPASPFQHWKQKHRDSWWLRWFVQRRPVKTDRYEKTAFLTVDLERYRAFPQCNYVFPKDLGPYVNVAVTRDHWSLR